MLSRDRLHYRHFDHFRHKHLLVERWAFPPGPRMDPSTSLRAGSRDTRRSVNQLRAQQMATLVAAKPARNKQ